MELPWLLLPCDEEKVFFNVPGHNEILDFPLLEARGKKAVGASQGWLIMANDAMEITLWNPPTGHQIDFPPLSFSPQQEHSNRKPIIHKAILSSHPYEGPADYTVVAIFGELKKLVFFQRCQHRWAAIEEAGQNYDDIVPEVGGGVYALDDMGKIIYLQPERSPKIERQVTQAWTLKGDKLYLVFVGGTMCCVIRTLRKDNTSGYKYSTHQMKVYIVHSALKKWVEVGNIDKWTIFLGRNQSVAVACKGRGGFGQDCIYFTDDHDRGGDKDGIDVGVYDVKNQSFEAPPQYSEALQERCPWPLWFMPCRAIWP